MLQYITITKAGAKFMDTVRVGDYVNPIPPGTASWLTPSKDYDSVRVVNVRSDTELDVQLYKGNKSVSVDENCSITQNTTYKIVRRFTKDQQIDRLVAVAAGYNSNRVSLVWPPVALWYKDDDKKEMVDLGPQSIAACYAAAKTSYPAQQGFTNMPFHGPHQLKYSNDYFNRDQLKRLSASGWTVFVQDYAGGPISCRHQVMSDGTEATIVQQIDKVSIDIKNILKPMIGIWTITPDLLSTISYNVNGYLSAAASRKVERCGALIQGYQPPILRARLNGQNLDLPPTTVECRVNISLGHPFNNLELIIRGE